MPDSFDNNYLLSRQVAHEYNSPAVQTVLRYGIDPGQLQETVAKAGKPLSKSEQFQKKRKEELAEAGATPESQKAGEAIEPNAALEDPWIDPTAAFTGGFAGAAKISMSAGMKLMPSLGRALTSGVIGAVADYPIGIASEKVGEKYPAAALPFNVLAGMVSGATLENAVEKSVIRLVGKGVGSPKIKKMASAVYEELLTGDPESDLGKQVFSEYNSAFAKESDQDLSQIDMGTPKGDDSSDKEPRRGTKKISANPFRDLLFSERGSITFETPKEPIALRTKLFLDDSVDYMPALNVRSNKTGDVLLSDNINLDRLDSPENIEKTIAKISTVFEDKITEAKRGKVSNEETKRLADLTGMTVDSLLKRRKGQAFNAHEALAARKILVASAENLNKLAREIKNPAGDATEAKYEFMRALNTHYAIQAQVSGMTAEAGRALQAFKISAASDEARAKLVKEMIDDMPQGIDLNKMADMLSTYEYAEQVCAFTRKIYGAKTSDMFLEAWINGLLSGPQTHAVNILSNTLTALWMIPERATAAGIRKLTGGQGVESSEAIYQAYGLVEGFKDGLKAFAKIMRTGEPLDPIGKMEARKYKAITAANVQQLPLIKKIAPNMLQEGGTAARAVDLLGEGVRLPGRALNAEDGFFKGVGYRMELRAQAYRLAKQEGLKGDVFTKRVAEILANPETLAPHVHLAATDASRYQTFTRPLGEAGQAIQKVTAAHPALKLIVPFIRTPTNILKFAGERTPLAALSKNVRAEISAGGARRDLALAKMGLGSMVMATVGTFAASGMITGSGPANQSKRAALRRMGWQPYSRKIGDKYVSYNRVEPLGILMGVAADFVEIAGLAGDEMQPELEELAAAITMSVAKNVTSKTWLEGVSSVLEVLEDPNRYGPRWLQGYAKTLIPTGVAQIERTADPELEAIYSMMDAIKSRIPGMSADMPKRRDLWGNPISTAINENRSWIEVAASLANPFYISNNKSSPIDKEILRLGATFKRPRQTQTFEGVPIKLMPQEYDDFQVLMNETKLASSGKVLKDTLSDIIQRPEYKSLSDDDLKERRLRSVFYEAKQIAKYELINKHSILQSVINEAHRREAQVRQ